MVAILNKHIDLSDYESEELKIKVSNGGSLVVQSEGLDSALIVSAKHIQADENVNLSGVSNKFEIVDSIEEDGIYTFDICGVDEVELICEGVEGNIYIKVVD